MDSAREGRTNAATKEVLRYREALWAGYTDLMQRNRIDVNLIVNIFNDDIAYSADPLLTMCITHYQFEAIHPFQDGNGRTGRILNLLYLVNQNLLTQPVLYLSQYIIRNKEDYYHNLAGVTQRGEWKAWILFMLDAVEKTALITSNLIDTIFPHDNHEIHG